MPRKKKKREQKERPDGWPLRYYFTLVTTADTWYDFRVFRRMKVWKLKQVLKLFIREAIMYPLDTMALVYGGIVMETDQMLRDYRVTDVGYAMVLRGYEREWPDDAEELEESEVDARDVEEFLRTHGPTDVEYLDMGPEPDKNAPMEVSKEVVKYWMKQGVSMSDKNITIAPGKREKDRLDAITATYLPAPTRPPGERLEVTQPEGFEFTYTQPLEMQGETVPDEPLIEKERPTDFDSQVDQLMGTTNHAFIRVRVERVFTESNFNMEGASNTLIKKLGDDRRSQAQRPAEVELTRSENSKVDELMDSMGVSRDVAKNAFLECDKDTDRALEKLQELMMEDS